MVGSAQPDIGLARLVAEIKSREIAISRDYISQLGRSAPSSCSLLDVASSSSNLHWGYRAIARIDPRPYYIDLPVETNEKPAGL